MELKSINIVYDQIAKSFSKTRYKIWSGVKLFLDSIPETNLILDVGCGNGKNMLETPHLFYGLDISESLLNIAKEKTINKSNVIELLNGSITNIPYNDSFFDAIMSIAVIHHLTTQDDRVQAINEMIRVCKPGGQILITVWKLESNEVYNNGIKINDFDADYHDRYIEWTGTDQSTNTIFQRFYHFFTLDEIHLLIDKIISSNISDKLIKSYDVVEELNNYYIKINII